MTNAVIYLASFLGALTAIGSFVFGIYSFMKKRNKKHQNYKEIIENNAKEIELLKAEDSLICFGLSACLDGLIQLGANHNVPKAKKELDKYLNHKAHK